MRTLLVIPVAAAVAVIAGAGTGSGAVEARIPPVAAGYNVKATFSGTLTVHWGFKHSEQSRYGCGVWAAGGGLSKFHADSIRPARGYLELSRNRALWTGLSLLGKAKGTAEQSIDIAAGGVNWGGDTEGRPCTGVRPRRPESIDCGSRSFRTMRAILLAGYDRNFEPTLDPQDDLLGNFRTEPVSQVRLTMVAGREPFSSCGIPEYARKPHYARTFIEERSLRVTAFRDHRALPDLRRGESHRLSDHYGGACTDGVPARDCAFVLDLEVTITRTS